MLLKGCHGPARTGRSVCSDGNVEGIDQFITVTGLPHRPSARRPENVVNHSRAFVANDSTKTYVSGLETFKISSKRTETLLSIGKSFSRQLSFRNDAYWWQPRRMSISSSHTEATGDFQDTVMPLILSARGRNQAQKEGLLMFKITA